MRISDWSSDVCSSDLVAVMPHPRSQGRALDAGLFGVDLPGMEIDDRRSPVPLVHLPDRQARKAIGPQTEEAAAPRAQRSGARRVGKECVSTFKSRCSTYNYTK